MYQIYNEAAFDLLNFQEDPEQDPFKVSLKSQNSLKRRFSKNEALATELKMRMNNKD